MGPGGVDAVESRVDKVDMGLRAVSGRLELDVGGVLERAVWDKVTEVDESVRVTD